MHTFEREKVVCERISTKPSPAGLGILFLLIGLLAGSRAANAQNVVDFEIAAAKQATLLAVDRGISSLPPSAGQSAVYLYDPDLDTYTISPLVGPTALRSASTIGEGSVGFRIATSYFEASQLFGPAFYRVTPRGGTNEFANGVNLNATAKVWVTSLGATIGLTPKAQLSMNLPLVNVHANADTIFTTATPDGRVPGFAQVVGDQSPRTAVKAAVARGEQGLPGPLYWSSQSIPADALPPGDGLNLGRSEVSLRYRVYPGAEFDVAAELGALLPSPDEEDYAGTGTIAVVPRLIGQWAASDAITVRTDLGYEYDFDTSELRRFIWNAGVSLAFERYSVDLGFGGSEYADGIQWAPRTGTFSQGGITFDASTSSSVETSTTSAAFLFGVKGRLISQLYLFGAATVPVTSDAFEPVAIGTWGLEYYL